MPLALPAQLPTWAGIAQCHDQQVFTQLQEHSPGDGSSFQKKLRGLPGTAHGPSPVQRPLSTPWAVSLSPELGPKGAAGTHSGNNPRALVPRPLKGPDGTCRPHTAPGHLARYRGRVRKAGEAVCARWSVLS